MGNDTREDEKARQHEARARASIERSVTKFKKVAKKKKRKPNRLRAINQYWYELEAYFDSLEGEPIPVQNGGFMRGILEDILVVEVEKGTPMAQINALGSYLNSVGIKALVVEHGIRFVRLKEVTGDQEKKLNEILAEHKAKEAREKRDAASKTNEGEKPN
jgi:hypothetical protein